MTPEPTTRPLGTALPLFRAEFSQSLRSLGAWVIGNAAVIALYLPFYPSIGGSESLLEYFAAFPPDLITIFGLDQMASGAGYTQATYFSLTGFMIFAVASVSWGAAAIAGSEESGELELTLAHGVGRIRVVLERALALVARVAVLAASGVAVIWALNDVSRLSLDLGGVASAATMLVALTTFVGMAALCAGAATGRRSVATAVGAGLAGLAYVLGAVARSAGVQWLGAVSPVEWAFGSDPITSGLAWAGLGWLIGGAVLLLVVAAISFRRRDVGMT
jgi:ABC-2 type transport system permease protein